MGTIIFKSQICTTIEQSERLLEMGLKPETADMNWTIVDMDREGNEYSVEYKSIGQGKYQLSHPNWYIPAWSYDRLREIIANHYIAYSTDLKTTDYESLINEIEELIKHNELKKDYIRG